MSGDGRASPSGPRRAPYAGSRRKLVLAFDVGTTFSGVSYSILDPGQIPTIKGVTQFPAQLATSTACKIPTIIYYDQEGKVRAVGAEATQEGVYDRAQEEGWIKAEWFKLYLRSNFSDAGRLIRETPPLPPGKTAVQVLADFLTYLLDCTASYIKDTHYHGEELWAAFWQATQSTTDRASNDGIQYILSHPNGWEGKEQARMREAATKAGLVPDTPEGQHRLKFVTEGEASLHFAVQNRLLSQIQRNEGVVVVDAGGGTIDVSTYKRGVQNVETFEEISVAECFFHGSVFVTFAAQKLLRQILSESPYLDDLDDIVSCFDQTTKHYFRNDQEPQYIKFGSRKDNDAHVKIRFGQMKLEGTQIAKLFQASIDCVVRSVLEQKKSHQNVQYAVLVGGFSSSAWLFEQVRDMLKRQGVVVIRPENNVVKTVSDGAVSFYLDHYVHKRVAKVTYGIPKEAIFKVNDPEHLKRLSTVYVDAEGDTLVQGAFGVVLAKGTQVDEDKEFVRRYQHTTLDPTSIKKFGIRLYCYRGDNPKPEWMDVDTENFHRLFEIYAEIQPQRRTKSDGSIFYKTKYEVVIMFGLTEMKAFLRWGEGGIVRKTEGKVIYD